MDNDIVSEHAYRAASLDLTVEDIASGNCADLGNLIGLAYFSVADNDFRELRRKHTLHGSLYLVDAVIDYTVHAHIYICASRVVTSGTIGSDIKADDDSSGGRGKHNIRLIYRTDAAVDNLYAHLVVGDLLK